MSFFAKSIYFCFFLSSSLAFYFWGQRSLLVLMVVNLLSLVQLWKHINIRRISVNNYCIIISFVLLLLWSFLSRGLSQLVVDFFRYFPILSFCLLPNSICKDTYIFINKALQILLVFSFITYVFVSFFHLDFFNLGIIDSGSERHTLFNNYIFYIEAQYDYFQIIPRFNAFYLEPGHLGMICAFMLFANRYNFKDIGTYIYVVSLLFSLSLAGYLLSIIGYLVLNRHNFSHLIAFLCISCIIVLLAVNYNGGDNVFNNLIIERISLEDDGFARNSRTSDEFNNYFTNYMHTKEYLFGIDNNTFRQLQSYNINGAGYKIYIMNYGLVGILFISYFYYSIASKIQNRRYSLAFLVILIFAFVQRAYPWWFSWIIPFFAGSLVENSNK